jgi:1-deoxy-D-xylulose-5-phosphate synthase
MNFGIPREFLAHGKRNEVLAACGLTAQDIARDVVEHVATYLPSSTEALEQF